MCVMQGALYLRMKTEGGLADRMGRIALGAFAAFAGLFAIATAATTVVSPFLFARAGHPAFWIVPAALAVALAVIPVATRAGRRGAAFLASSIAIVLALAAVAQSAYPVLVPSSLGLENSLTIYNASSTPRTLGTMLVIALLGVPVMLGYTAWVYRVFKGPVRPGDPYGASDALRRAA
jgi:cytochrome d ubiquinol oxidase subunit II